MFKFVVLCMWNFNDVFEVYIVYALLVVYI